LHKDGCSGGLDGHHITEVGEGGDDVIENIISLCRWHHGLAQEYRITKEELYAILALYHGYKYEGIQPWTTRFIKKNLEAPKLWIHRKSN
jgi:predicted restriction endonuclease